MVSANNLSYTIMDNCSHCKGRIRVSDIKESERIVGRIVECPNCGKLHRVDSNLRIESIDYFLNRQCCANC